MSKLSDFLTGYLECALWSSIDSNDNPFDRDFAIEDFEGETLARAERDCENFQRENVKALTEYYQHHGASSAGHDFWLTRNGHGSGFWDRPSHRASEKFATACELLSDASRDFKGCDLYDGDDGELYFM